MNALTIALIVIAIAALIFGWHRGIVREAASLCAILLAIVACQLFANPATAVAARLMGVDMEGGSSASHYSAKIVGCAAVFLLVWLGVFLLSRMLRGAIRAVHLGVIDQFAGALFSCGKWMLVASLLLNIIYMVAPAASMWGSDPPQGFIKGVLGFAPWLFGIVRSAAT